MPPVYSAGGLKHGALSIEEGAGHYLTTCPNCWRRPSKRVKVGSCCPCYHQFPLLLVLIAVDACIELPQLPAALMPLLTSSPPQLLVYYAAAVVLDVESPATW